MKAPGKQCKHSTRRSSTIPVVTCNENPVESYERSAEIEKPIDSDSHRNYFGNETHVVINGDQLHDTDANQHSDNQQRHWRGSLIQEH